MSLGLLVGRFGEFLSQQPIVQQEASSAPSFPIELAKLREIAGHHLVALSLLSRVDGNSAPSERGIIVEYCSNLARKRGYDVDTIGRTLLDEYLRTTRPTRMQLMPAIDRLASDSDDDVRALIVTAKAVVEVDGVTRAEEVKFLAELSGDISPLMTS